MKVYTRRCPRCKELFKTTSKRMNAICLKCVRFNYRSCGAIEVKD